MTIAFSITTIADDQVRYGRMAYLGRTKPRFNRRTANRIAVGFSKRRMPQMMISYFL